MSTPEIVGLVIVVILIAALIAAIVRIAVTRRALRERFGDEYDRAVTEQGGRAAAEAELRRRERRHARLPLRELNSEQLAAYRDLWTEVQARFVDDPVAAVQSADKLVARIVADRGYPVVEYPDRLAHLSVDHAGVLQNYRSAHDISVRNDAGQASTEELRQAMVDFRAIVTDLLGADPSAGTGARSADPQAGRDATALGGGTAYGDGAPASDDGAGPAGDPGDDDGRAPTDAHDSVDPALGENAERVLTPADEPQPPADGQARKGH